MRRVFSIITAAIVLAGVAGCFSGCGQSVQGTDEKVVVAQSNQENNTVLSFPAYDEETYQEKFGIEPFEISLTLPQGWEIKNPEDKEKKEQESYGMLLSPVELYADGQYVGVIACNTYEPMEDVPEEDYYKVVYSGIRLGSLYAWEMDPYTPIASGETWETALATVRYKDPEQMNSGKSAAEIPDIEVPGIVSYDDSRHVYIAIQFAENSASSEEIEEIAKSIVFE